MSNESVSKIYDAEKSADYAENQAHVRANEIIEDAKTKAGENTAKMTESARMESERRIADAKQKGDALVLSMEENAKEQVDFLDRIVKEKQHDAVEKVIENLI